MESNFSINFKIALFATLFHIFLSISLPIILDGNNLNGFKQIKEQYIYNRQMIMTTAFIIFGFVFLSLYATPVALQSLVSLSSAIRGVLPTNYS